MADGKVDLTALGRSQLIERIRKLEHDLELAQDDLRVAQLGAVPVAKLQELLTEWRERRDEKHRTTMWQRDACIEELARLLADRAAEGEQLRDEIATLRALIDTRVPGERLDELIDTWRHRAAVLREEGERAEASGFTSCADALELVVSASAKG